MSTLDYEPDPCEACLLAAALLASNAANLVRVKSFIPSWSRALEKLDQCGFDLESLNPLWLEQTRHQLANGPIHLSNGSIEWSA
ncbi:MAG: hypothetical protein WCF04_00570 [Candidatus Nanopelagicales bacterium]